MTLRQAQGDSDSDDVRIMQAPKLVGIILHNYMHIISFQTFSVVVTLSLPKGCCRYLNT
jgi:hypothetical protein